jgi:hypothetical protein
MKLIYVKDLVKFVIRYFVEMRKQDSTKINSQIYSGLCSDGPKDVSSGIISLSFRRKS